MGSIALIRDSDNGVALKEISSTQENYLAYQAGLYLADSANIPGALIKTSSTDAASIGSYTNTRYDKSLSDHGGTFNILSTTTTLYQHNPNFDESDSDVRRPLEQVIEASGQSKIFEMDSDEMDTLSARLASRIFTSDYPGTVQLATSAPSGDYTLVEEAFRDTRANDDSDVNIYNIYKRTSMSAPSTARPFALKRHNDSDNGAYEGLQAMTDRQIKHSFGHRVKSLINPGTSSVGSYQLRSSGQGAPTDSGTWVAKGTATDTRFVKTASDYTRNITVVRYTDYLGDFTNDYTGTFTRDFTGQFEGTYVGSESYTGTFVGDFVRDVVNFAGLFTGEFQGADFTGTYATAYTGNFVPTYSRSSTNTFSGTGATFTGDEIFDIDPTVDALADSFAANAPAPASHVTEFQGIMAFQGTDYLGAGGNYAREFIPPSGAGVVAMQELAGYLGAYTSQNAYIAGTSTDIAYTGAEGPTAGIMHYTGDFSSQIREYLAGDIYSAENSAYFTGTAQRDFSEFFSGPGDSYLGTFTSQVGDAVQGEGNYFWYVEHGFGISTTHELYWNNILLFRATYAANTNKTPSSVTPYPFVDADGTQYYAGTLVRSELNPNNYLGPQRDIYAVYRVETSQTDFISVDYSKNFVGGSFLGNVSDFGSSGMDFTNLTFPGYPGGIGTTYTGHTFVNEGGANAINFPSDTVTNDIAGSFIGLAQASHPGADLTMNYIGDYTANYIADGGTFTSNAGSFTGGEAAGNPQTISHGLEVYTHNQGMLATYTGTSFQAGSSPSSPIYYTGPSQDYSSVNQNIEYIYIGPNSNEIPWMNTGYPTMTGGSLTGNTAANPGQGAPAPDDELSDGGTGDLFGFVWRSNLYGIDDTTGDLGALATYPQDINWRQANATFAIVAGFPNSEVSIGSTDGQFNTLMQAPQIRIFYAGRVVYENTFGINLTYADIANEITFTGTDGGTYKIQPTTMINSYGLAFYPVARVEAGYSRFYSKVFEGGNIFLGPTSPTNPSGQYMDTKQFTNVRYDFTSLFQAPSDTSGYETFVGPTGAPIDFTGNTYIQGDGSDYLGITPSPTAPDLSYVGPTGTYVGRPNTDFTAGQPIGYFTKTFIDEVFVGPTGSFIPSQATEPNIPPGMNHDIETFIGSHYQGPAQWQQFTGPAYNVDVNFLDPFGAYVSSKNVGGDYLGPTAETYVGGAAGTINPDAGPYATAVQSTDYISQTPVGVFMQAIYTRAMGEGYIGPDVGYAGVDRLGGSAINYIAEGVDNGGSYAGTFIPGEYLGTAGFVTNYSGAAQYSGTFVGTFVSDTEYTTDYTRNYDGGTSFTNTFTGTYARDASETFTGDANFTADAEESFVNENISFDGAEYNADFTEDYERDFATDFTSVDAESFTGDFTGDYSGDVYLICKSSVTWVQQF
jgi:hypothetical protein